MLHTDEVHCGLVQCIRQLELKHSNGNTYVHNSLCDAIPQCMYYSLHTTALRALYLNSALALATKSAERITGEMLNNFNIKHYGKY